jgi:hypothetical protein
MVDDEDLDWKLLFQLKAELPDGVEDPDIARIGRIAHFERRCGEKCYVASPSEPPSRRCRTWRRGMPQATSGYRSESS